MGKLTKSIEIESSPEEVFSFINDMEKMNDALKGMLESKYTSEGPVGVGSTMHVIERASGSHAEWDMEITEFVKNKKLATRTPRASKLKMADLFTLEPTARGTKVTYDMDYEVPYSLLGKLVDKVKVSKDMEKSMSKMLENIKRALEA